MIERVLVCGGRECLDRQKVFDTMDYCHQWFAERFILIQGEAKGADRLAKEWAIKHGYPHAGVPANWFYYDKPAGNIRNTSMLLLKPQLLIAFPGGRGTADMVKKATFDGVPVYAL